MTEQFIRRMEHIIQYQLANEIDLLISDIENYIGIQLLEYNPEFRRLFTDFQNVILFWKPYVQQNRINDDMKTNIFDALNHMFRLKNYIQIAIQLA